MDLPGKIRAAGINPQEKMKTLAVQFDRGVYTRSPY